MYFGRNDAKAETPVLWPPPAKSWLIGKDSDAGRDWGQEEKGTTEDEMAGWHHWLDGRESQWTPGVGDRQGGLACCDSWGRNELDTTERLIWSDLYKGTWAFGLILRWPIKFSLTSQVCKAQIFPHFLFLHKAYSFIHSTKYLRIYYIRHWDAMIINTSLMLQERMI